MGFYCILAAFGLVFTIAAGYEHFDELYNRGVAFYEVGDWKSAIDNLEKSMASYSHYKVGLAGCVSKCRNASSGNLVIDQSSIGRIASKASCLKGCLNDEFGSFTFITRAMPYIKEDLGMLIPYQYLQYAYFKEGDLAKSVSAAYTFSIRFPEDEMMRDNMEYFRKSEEVTKDMFVNLEPQAHLEIYNQALQAYLKEDYKSAASLFEKASNEYYKAVTTCHDFCEGEETTKEEQWEIDFYKQNAYHYIHVLECSLKCVRQLSSEVHGQVYPNYLPLHYHYLQFAHYQNEDYRSAAECAMSYLIFHPGDSVMEGNLKSISEDIDVSTIQARVEAQEHHKRMTTEAAMLQYSYQNFGMKAVDQTLVEPFFVASSANGMKSVKDDIKDSVINTDDAEYQKTAEAENVDSDDSPYKSMKEKTADIINKKDVESERKLIEALKTARDEQHYTEPDDDVDISTLIDENSRPGYRVIDSKYLVSLLDAAPEDPIAEGPIIIKGAVLTANSTQLKGKERFAIDGLATPEECSDLIDLEVSFGKPGDGYNGRESPHTKFEKFEGVNMLRAAQMAEHGLLPLKTALLYYELSEKARAQVQAYFRLPHLFFDYTHLVCRTAKSDSTSGRNDLSHPIHADNCLLQKDGSCIKEPPAYTWRDYSAILYLNGDFEGGEFLFTDSTARRVRTMVKPKCGRMVSFGAGRESYHGVKPVVEGRRCAVALWFTLSEKKNEKIRIEARNILDKLSSRQKDEL